jgi:hypothetical protein
LLTKPLRVRSGIPWKLDSWGALRLIKVKETQLEFISRPQPGASEPIRVTINRGRARLGLPELTRSLWDWRMAHPGGAHLGVARDSSGQVLAAVVGMAHPTRLAGETVDFMELVELCNDFEAGTGLARTQAMDELCAAFASQHGGRAPEGMPVIYGWPTRRAHRYLLGRQKAEVLRSEQFLLASREQLSHLCKPLTADLELESVKRFPSTVTALFERFSQGREALLVRDEARLNHRFAEHPDRDYQIALLRRGGELQGYAVLRRDERGACQLSDWCVPMDDGPAIDALVAWAAEVTLAGGGSELSFGVSTCSPEYRHFQGLGFRVVESQYMLFRSFQKPFIMSWLFEHWFYTFGDLERG